MTEEKQGLWAKFMGIYWTLPFGNGGRGTRVYLFPFVGVAAVAVIAPIIDKFLIG